MKTVSFYTQGCRLNQSETASIEQSFLHKNYAIIPFGQASDIVVINTCTVTENGDADTRKLINKVISINSKAKIALIGCQSQIFKEALLQLKNVQWVIGNNEKMNLEAIVTDTFDSEIPVVSAKKIKREAFRITTAGVDQKHTRANIKIQDGCDFYCAFCVIPFARGPARSRVFDDILHESQQLVDAGHREIVLTGINIGTYDYDNKNIYDVIESLARLKELERIRISSIEPTTIPETIIQSMKKNQKLCRYLHIPIQSGSDTLLKKMNRHYSVGEFRSFIQHAYDEVPDICIGTDVIVGFPGETNAHFDETVANLLTMPIHYFHVFSYSERKFARSKSYEGQLPRDVIEKRSKILRTLSKKKRKEYYSTFVGRKGSVLFEQYKHGFWSGHTDTFVKVKVASEKNLKNKLLEVNFEKYDNESLLGYI